MLRMLFVIVLSFPLLLCGKEATVGYLGVYIDNLSDAMKTALDLEHGVIVDKVLEDTPAEEGGIEVGDVILKIDDDEIPNRKVLKELIKGKPNERIALRIHRGGKTMTKYVVLGEKEHKKIELDLDVDIPDIEEFEDIMVIKKGELKEELENLKEELEKLKVELEKLKEDLTK